MNDFDFERRSFSVLYEDTLFHTILEWKLPYITELNITLLRYFVQVGKGFNLLAPSYLLDHQLEHDQQV